MEMEEMKRWYDGYQMGHKAAIYNPYSVMKALQRRSFESYWTNTNVYEGLRQYITMDFDGLKDAVIQLIAGESVPDLSSDTSRESVEKCVDKNSYAVMDNLSGHSGVEKVVAGSDRQTTPGKDAPKRLPWVHVAIANAKTFFKDMYHGIKDEFLQYYLDEFCYKFNRMYFGDRMFDRIVLAATSYKPTFKHRTYASAQCG